MKVGVFAYDSSYTVGGHLHHMLESLGFDTYSFFAVVDAKNFGIPKSDTHVQIGLDNFTDPGLDMVIFMGSRIIFEFTRQYPAWFAEMRKRDVRTVLMDSHYMKDFVNQNNFYREMEIKVFAMPDHSHLVPDDLLAGVYHLPFPRIEYDGKKNNVLTVSHSPGTFSKTKQKGSEFISAVVWRRKARYDFNYDLIMYSTWGDCLSRKARSHIFIDQLIEEPYYRGGLGKSGIEAMLLGNVVMTSGTSDPAIHIDTASFKGLFLKVIEDEEYRKEQLITQNKWLEEFILSDYYPKLLTK